MDKGSGTTTQKILCLAYVQRPRGVQGDLRIVQKGTLLNRYLTGDVLYFYKATGVHDGFLKNPEKVREGTYKSLQSITSEHNSLRLEDVKNVDEATVFKSFFIGLELNLAIEKFGGEKEPFLFEYIDSQGVTEAGEPVGVLDRVEEYGNMEWFIFINSENTEIMVPRQSHFVAKVNLKERQIVLRNLDELSLQ
ncbi:MAG: hypothetical protein ABUK01_09710 [Leptospirales bacterium]